MTMGSTPTKAGSPVKNETKPSTSSKSSEMPKLQKKPSFCAGDQMITFQFSKEQFMVHKQFAFQYSPVVKRYFGSSYRQSMTYTLHDKDPKGFSELVEWLYYQSLDAASIIENHPFNAPRVLVGLWLLAEKLEIPRLQNLAIDLIEKVSQLERKVPTSVLDYVYVNTPAGSPLRRLILDKCVWDLTSEGFAKNTHEFTRDVLVDLAEMLKGMADKTKPKPPRTMAKFHVKEGANSP